MNLKGVFKLLSSMITWYATSEINEKTLKQSFFFVLTEIKNVIKIPCFRIV